jgi:hypothetical protein
MKRNLLRRLGVSLSLVAFSLAHIALAQTGSAKPATSKPKLSEETFKNIQILKGTPAEQLIPAMQFISYSLGVQCSFCHVEGALEKDDKKPKQTARKMMQMMAQINQATFNGKRKITCYSCHHGSSRPVNTPIIAEEGAALTSDNVPNVQAPTPPDVPQVDQVLARYVDAIGKSSIIGKLTTRVEKGHITLAGRQFLVEIFSKIPGKRLSVIHLPNGDSVTAYNEMSGWTSTPNRKVRDLPTAEIVSSRPEADLQLPIHLKQFFSEVKTDKPEMIGDHEVYVISCLNDGELAAKFYFDEHSGLLLRMLRFVNSPLGLNPTQIDYGDYREQDGVKMPFLETVSRPNSRFTIQIDEAKYNVPTDDARFARPTDPSANAAASP